MRTGLTQLCPTSWQRICPTSLWNRQCLPSETQTNAHTHTHTQSEQTSLTSTHALRNDFRQNPTLGRQSNND